MRSCLLDALVFYIDKVDKKEMTIQEFKAEFDSVFEEAMIPYIHPYGRDEFLGDFYNSNTEWCSK